MAHTVALVLTDHLPVFEFAVPCEVFGIDRSDIVNPWYELMLCAAEPGTLRTTGASFKKNTCRQDLQDLSAIYR